MSHDQMPNEVMKNLPEKSRQEEEEDDFGRRSKTTQPAAEKEKAKPKFVYACTPPEGYRRRLKTQWPKGDPDTSWSVSSLNVNDDDEKSVNSDDMEKNDADHDAEKKEVNVVDKEQSQIQKTENDAKSG